VERIPGQYLNSDVVTVNLIGTINLYGDRDLCPSSTPRRPAL
jgi:hypothetical protein